MPSQAGLPNPLEFVDTDLVFQHSSNVCLFISVILNVTLFFLARLLNITDIHCLHPLGCLNFFIVTS